MLGRELDDLFPQIAAWNRIQMIGIDHALGRHAVGDTQGDFGRNRSNGTGDLGDGDFLAFRYPLGARYDDDGAKPGLALELYPPDRAAGQWVFPRGKR